ncbi:hypothetical protein [Nocardia sp. NPDC059239]|uniref:hypothetical protein n=1 Tax=unclassified Nocardia TaxID=2637762 RepID=UPI003695F097
MLRHELGFGRKPAIDESASANLGPQQVAHPPCRQLDGAGQQLIEPTAERQAARSVADVRTWNPVLSMIVHDARLRAHAVTRRRIELMLSYAGIGIARATATCENVSPTAMFRGVTHGCRPGRRWSSVNVSTVDANRYRRNLPDRPSESL